jgi:hypothetical protein
LQASCLMLTHFRCHDVGCCRVVHYFPQYIHYNITYPDRLQFSDLLIKIAQCSHFSAATKYDISFPVLLTSLE